MRIYLKNNSAKFHLDPIWNYGAFRFFEKRRPNKYNKKMGSVLMGSVPVSWSKKFNAYSESC